MAEFSLAGRTTTSPTRRTAPALATPPRRTSSSVTESDLQAERHATALNGVPDAVTGRHAAFHLSPFIFDFAVWTAGRLTTPVMRFRRGTASASLHRVPLRRPPCVFICKHSVVNGVVRFETDTLGEHTLSHVNLAPCEPGLCTPWCPGRVDGPPPSARPSDPQASTLVFRSRRDAPFTGGAGSLSEGIGCEHSPPEGDGTHARSDRHSIAPHRILWQRIVAPRQAHPPPGDGKRRRYRQHRRHCPAGAARQRRPDSSRSHRAVPTPATVRFPHAPRSAYALTQDARRRHHHRRRRHLRRRLRRTRCPPRCRAQSGARRSSSRPAVPV